MGGLEKPCHDEMSGLTDDALIRGRRLTSAAAFRYAG